MISPYIIQLLCIIPDPCPENDVRISDGVIQVCHDGQWGLVCQHSNSYDLDAAEVVCDQVGIPSVCEFLVP